MTDTGNNPFAEPDFSALHPGAENDDLGEDDYGEEDDAIDADGLDEDNELEDEDEDEDELDGAAAFEEVAELESETVDADVGGQSADEDDAGNRVLGGTARSVLEHVAKSIVDDPEGVTVEVAETRTGIRLSLHVAQGDMGRIIGRRGRTAQALRTLVRAAAARDGKEASVDIVD